MSDNKIISVIVIGGALLLLIGIPVAIKIGSKESEAAPIESSTSIGTLPTTTTALPTKPGPPPQKTPVQTELETLRAENEALRQEREIAVQAAQQAKQALQQSVQQNTRPAIPSPAKESIPPQVVGSVWLNRDDGSSELLRGLRIRVLPTTIPTQLTRECVERDADEWKLLMDDFLPQDVMDRIKDLRGKDPGQLNMLRSELEKRVSSAHQMPVSGKTVPTNDAIAHSAQLYAAKLGSARRIIFAGEAAVFELGPSTFDGRLQASLNDTRVSLLQLGSKRSNALRLERLSIAEFTSGVDGKYMIEGMKPGDFCIHAELNLPKVFAEWAIPVHIANGAELKLDLHNDNAVLVIRH